MALQRWQKLGRLYDPAGLHPWAMTHAAVPVAVPIGGDRYRVFVTGRDAESRSHIGYFELDLSGREPLVSPLSDSPVLCPGGLGCFDDRGAMTGSVVVNGNRQFHYYTGWNLGVTVPFYFTVGLALSDDGGATLRRFSDGPVLGRSIGNPLLAASAFVLVEQERWRMWYVSGSRWVPATPRPKHYYHIRYAESRDGIRWEATGKVCIDYKNADEYAISRPCVLREGRTYRMWFSHRGESYRIGYAESRDGLNWQRRDEEVGLDVSDAGWDSEMIEYPYVFRNRNRLYMLYNGNGYGLTGVGLAVLE